MPVGWTAEPRARVPANTSRRHRSRGFSRKMRCCVGLRKSASRMRVFCPAQAIAMARLLTSVDLPSPAIGEVIRIVLALSEAPKSTAVRMVRKASASRESGCSRTLRPRSDMSLPA